MLRSHRRHYNDCYHDFSHTKQIHRSWLVINGCTVLAEFSERACIGRKEIIMFFYLYAIIELLAIFLDSNVIPTANVSYPVGYRAEEVSALY